MISYLLNKSNHSVRTDYCLSWGKHSRSKSRAFCISRFPLRWRHTGRDSVSNHQPHDCLLNRLFRRRSKNTTKLRVTGLCVWEFTGDRTGEFPAQMASNAENASIWWRHHALGQWCPSSSFVLNHYISIQSEIYSSVVINPIILSRDRES